jgi:hypothetical protein
LESADIAPDSEAACRLLDLSNTWEDGARPVADVVDEFRYFVPLDLEFEPPTTDELLSEVASSSDEGEEIDEL